MGGSSWPGGTALLHVIGGYEPCIKRVAPRTGATRQCAACLDLTCDQGDVNSIFMST